MNKRFKLEKQLHEQYAINNNANITSIIALITTLLGVIGVYGYIFVHSNIDFAEDWGKFVVVDGKYSLDVLLFSAITSYFILVIIFYLSAYLGTNQRKEQFITFAIRSKYYEKKGKKHKNKNYYDEIFPRNYNPFNKSKSNFIQGLYGEICCIQRILFWLISFLTIGKLGYNICKYYKNGVVSYSALSVIVLFTIFFILSLVSFYCINEKLYHSYQERESEFLVKKCGLEYKNNMIIVFFT